MFSVNRADIVTGAIQQAEPQGDGPNIQVFILEHLHDGENFSFTEHGIGSLYAIDGFKDQFVLDGQIQR